MKFQVHNYKNGKKLGWDFLTQTRTFDFTEYLYLYLVYLKAEMIPKCVS